MNIEEARAYCHAYLDGQLDAKTKSEIERLLASDAALSDYYAEQREFLALVNKRARDVAPPVNLEEGIRARLKTARSSTSAANVFATSIHRMYHMPGNRV